MRTVETDNIITWVNDEFRNFQQLFQQNRAQCIQRFADPNCLPGKSFNEVYTPSCFLS